ncbi:HAMP domain-containing histidine kinase [Pseudenhygromyxa sp. WMMC2535]|uniref:HAMP domain-containing sensor histidine kinase n=1 Tax=Pseudenhygromyxa sp. WMMC2535 TaxID=2712867 RepID=UPI001556ACCC|nr:HAMP domain-containing sensor histidine kinase [Pseudenhygromyxa sp. WMMC2535]NVB37508.1 HAMP domain-containing histidine kinase [Pseudenhygromyxa sp. WMMC2535]
MQLRARLMVFGALVPMILLVAAITVSGLVFDRVLLAEHDRALLGQAGVEAVSLFDRAATPHLHLLDSPLDSQIRDFTPRGALYDPEGRAIARYPLDASIPTSLAPERLTLEPMLRTIDGASGRDRELFVRVDGPDGQPYGLWLAASLERHDREMASYRRIAAAVIAGVGLILLAIQLLHARRLARRVTNLSDHMRRLRAGTLERPPPEDLERDEIGELRQAIAETTVRLAAARSSQDRLIADAAHELRTPLAALRAGIDVALRRERSAEQLRESLEHARVEVDRLTALSSSLLDLAALRASPLERGRGDLVAVLIEAIDAARALAEERGCLVRLEAPEHAATEFAPAALRQALDNLLSNAIKFSPAATEISVSLAAASSPEGDAAWRFEICDHGPGVPVEAREVIFEPFHRLGRGTPGAGLGLAIVRDVAERHHGRVWVEDSEHSEGACFVLELPQCA